MFEERTDGTGELVQAESDLEYIHDHVKDLKAKAIQMGEMGEESMRRVMTDWSSLIFSNFQVENISQDTTWAQARTKKNIEREEKILK